MRDIGEDSLFGTLEERVELFLTQLGRLPAFRPELERSDRQGDIGAVREASDVWLSIKCRLERRPELLRRIYNDKRWLNYRRLLEHSTRFVQAQKKRDAERYKRQSTPAVKAARAEKERQRRRMAWLRVAEPAMKDEIRDVGLDQSHDNILSSLRKHLGDQAEKVYARMRLQVAAEIDSSLLPAMFEEIRKHYPKTTWEQVERLRDEAHARRSRLN
jgi:hypothetical protein